MNIPEQQTCMWGGGKLMRAFERMMPGGSTAESERRIIASVQKGEAYGTDKTEETR